jgi:hypothetical protein
MRSLLLGLVLASRQTNAQQNHRDLPANDANQREYSLGPAITWAVILSLSKESQILLPSPRQKNELRSLDFATLRSGWQE